MNKNVHSELAIHCYVTSYHKYSGLNCYFSFCGSGLAGPSAQGLSQAVIKVLASTEVSSEDSHGRVCIQAHLQGC